MLQKYLFILLIILSGIKTAVAQITVENSVHQQTVTYTNGTSDQLFIVCGAKDDANITIEATTSFSTATTTFTWEKYDTIAHSFSWFADGQVGDTLNSRLTGLREGCYKVTISNGSTVEEDQVWVIQDWILASADIPDSSSTCDYFRIFTDVTASKLSYFDLSNSTRVDLRNDFSDFEYLWEHESIVVSAMQNPTITTLIASESTVPYDLTVEDKYGCTETITVDYISKVPKADFSFDPASGEAVLEVTFTNNSINYDFSAWSFSKKWADIATELEESETGEVDSVKFVLEEEAPVYEYEDVGNYSVFLAVSKENSTGTCFDTTWMDPATYISVDESLVEAPNFFTPNGDGENDNFVIRSKSLKKCTIKIYNRWGSLVHSWRYTNIRSNDYTYEHSVWDGTIGNRMASPGVYYYFISAEGRDDKKYRLNGFVHLFQEKGANND